MMWKIDVKHSLRDIHVLQALLVIATLAVLAGCGTSAAGTAGQRASILPPHHGVNQGKVVFGQGLKHGGIVHATKSFACPKRVAWKADFGRTLTSPASATITIIRLNGPGRHPRMVWRGSRRVKINQGLGSFTSRFLDAHHVIDGGEYALAVTYRGQLLAKGRFCLKRMGGGMVSTY